ncbi:MAG: transketolase C-terminal domain-containing protein [Polyangiaceae bacterium]
MRTAFARALLSLAARDPRVFLLTGDLGYSVLEPFRERFPERFVNVGVAEQNMLGIAAGLAHSGNVVFVYSIANFPTLRCLEQIRNDVCYHDLPVRVVSVGGGLAYGSAGYTHHGVEDLAVMRALPGMSVFAPGDPLETELITGALLDLKGPAYLRLGKANEPAVHRAAPALELGRALELQSGSDITLLATGGMLFAASEAARELEQRYAVSVRLLSVHTLKPLDEATITLAAQQTRLVVTCEEHSCIGGLGSAVADVMAALPNPRARLVKYALPDRASDVVGSQRYLLSRLGSIVDCVRREAPELCRERALAV